jgi:hypothetical protein
MCSFLTFGLQLFDSPMQVSMAFPHGCGKHSLSLGNTVSQLSDLIIGHICREKRSNVTVSH